ncbi:MAG TPA: hypothetical protein VG122_15405 [Gemmata sp.]|jgi:hypothetical protein|nr:hypothetical protein [Gemmata sp.]
MPVDNRVRHLPTLPDVPRVETGAVQFGDDWPGLFIRGDNAQALMFLIRRMAALLSDHPDTDVTHAMEELMGYAEMIAQDVIVR